MNSTFEKFLRLSPVFLVVAGVLLFVQRTYLIGSYFISVEQITLSRVSSLFVGGFAASLTTFGMAAIVYLVIRISDKLEVSS